MPPFEMTIAVQPQDIDQQNHVNNTVYVHWIQEVATAHWNAAASAPDAIGWVVLRHEIDYKLSACLGDQIVLRPWVGKATRVTFERFVEVLRQSDRKLLARARTLWVPINPEFGKPTRVRPKSVLVSLPDRAPVVRFRFQIFSNRDAILPNR